MPRATASFERDLPEEDVVGGGGGNNGRLNRGSRTRSAEPVAQEQAEGLIKAKVVAAVGASPRTAAEAKEERQLDHEQPQEEQGEGLLQCSSALPAGTLPRFPRDFAKRALSFKRSRTSLSTASMPMLSGSMAPTSISSIKWN